MFFFQAALLSGYAYAHFSIRLFRFKWQIITVVTMFCISLLLLPFVIDQHMMPAENINPALWLLSRLILSVGFPLFVISTLSSLLQRWFFLSGHRFSADPYFLYAAGNAGSMAALLSYPFCLERFFTTSEQSLFWTIGFGLLGLMVILCGLVTQKTKKLKQTPESHKTGLSETNQNKPDWRTRFFWLFAAFVPSSLMLSVTTYIITDLAAIPLLYILPLALYLLTFILAFARKRIILHKFTIGIIPFILIPMVPSFFYLTKAGLILIPIHLTMFFFVALGCHGELANRRPPARNLTEFYLFLAIGGALGGLFNAFIYPNVFNDLFEYPLATFLACLIIAPSTTDCLKNQVRSTLSSVLIPILFFFISLIIMHNTLLPGTGKPFHLFLFIIISAPMIRVLFKLKNQPFRFALCYGMLLLAVGVLANITHGKDEYISRNFYGVKRIKVDQQQGIRSLVHGVTVHGRQFITGPSQNQPLAYFHKTGPLGDIFTAHHQTKSDADIAVIGLGVGSVASYIQPSETITFYEIDPEVIRIAHSRQFFTFLSNLKAKYFIVPGDARLKLQHAQKARYDIIFLDAFNSDSVPIHLLTEEAIDLYLSRLKPDGFLVFQVSNRYVDLKPVLARHTKDKNLMCIYKFDSIDNQKIAGKDSSEYAVIAKPDSIIQPLLKNNSWQVMKPDHTVTAWTDQYSSILKALKL